MLPEDSVACSMYELSGFSSQITVQEGYRTV